MDTRAERFPLFDSLRAIGCLGVIVGHCAAFGDMVSPGAAVKPYVDQIAVVLTLFFLVSGFLLYRPFVAARLEGRPAIRIRDYTRRRVLRIVPAYWVALTVLALWPGLAFTGPRWTYYAFVQNYDLWWVLGGLGQAWSLA